MIKGTGRTEGSMGLLLISIAMMVGGFYLLLSAIHVSSSFGFGARLFGVSAFGGVGITGGDADDSIYLWRGDYFL
jgi:hypothetical protein